MTESDINQAKTVVPEQNESKIQAYQLGRIRRLVRHAYDNVPLYRRKYASAGINPCDIRTLSDFTALPILTKEELQAAAMWYPLQGIAGHR